MYISFSYPGYLAFLFIIPILIFFHFYGIKNLKGRALNFANFDAIARVKGIDLYSKNISVLIFDILFLILLVFSLSGLTLHKEVDASSFSFVIAIDASQSMLASDLKPDRLSAAKETAIDFIGFLPYESRAGVISFAGDSKTEIGISENKEIIKSAIDGIEVSYVGGTDIYEAVKNSIKLLRNEKSKAIVLLSDGQINVGNINEAIEEAIAEKVMLHTIAVGTIEGGNVSYGLSRLDEDSLRALAYNTEGSFFEAGDKEKMREAFKDIIKETKKLGSINLAPYLMMVIIILFLIKQFLISINKIMW